jgi:mRNA deadenylase 3'-5' endonuclease subunit Ccr4
MLTPPIIFESAYANILQKILAHIKELSLNSSIQPKTPFDKLIDSSSLDDCEVYGIKMGFADIDKTLSYVKNYTLEPPFSFYAKEMMALVDYIFFEGSLTPVRTLNIPDVNKVAFDIGYLPNEHFPSDHISLCADFQLLD